MKQNQRSSWDCSYLTNPSALNHKAPVAIVPQPNSKYCSDNDSRSGQKGAGRSVQEKLTCRRPLKTPLLKGSVAMFGKLDSNAVRDMIFTHSYENLSATLSVQSFIEFCNLTKLCTNIRKSLPIAYLVREVNN